MSGSGDKPEEKETNFYLITLRSCRDTLIPDAADAVYNGTGDPGSAIAKAISGGGWVCTEADKWVTELTAHTSKVMPAFTDAIAAVNHEISAEQARFPDDDHQVPKGHPHGLAWNRTWHIMQHNI
jgi:hypothetical protein